MRAMPQMTSPRTIPKIPAMTRMAATIQRSVYMTVLYPSGASGMQRRTQRIPVRLQGMWQERTFALLRPKADHHGKCR